MSGRPPRYLKHHDPKPAEPLTHPKLERPVCIEPGCIHPAEERSNYCRMHDDIYGSRGLRDDVRVYNGPRGGAD